MRDLRVVLGEPARQIDAGVSRRRCGGIVANVSFAITTPAGGSAGRSSGAAVSIAKCTGTSRPSSIAPTKTTRRPRSGNATPSTRGTSARSICRTNVITRPSGVSGHAEPGASVGRPPIRLPALSAVSASPKVSHTEGRSHGRIRVARAASRCASSTGAMRVDGDLTRLGGWMSSVHDAIVDRTSSPAGCGRDRGPNAEDFRSGSSDGRRRKAGRLDRSTRTSGVISRIYRIRALCKRRDGPSVHACRRRSVPIRRCCRGGRPVQSPRCERKSSRREGNPR